MADEAKEGGKKIARLAKGNKARTALHAEVMNEIIDAVNSLLGMEVSPRHAGTFKYSDGNVVYVPSATAAGGAIAVTDDAEPPHEVENVTQLNFIGGASVSDGGPTEDGLGEQADVLVGISVSDGTTQIDNVSLITFVPADDPVGGAITVFDNGGGEALVKIPILPASPDSGTQVVGVVGGSATYLSTTSC